MRTTIGTPATLLACLALAAPAAAQDHPPGHDAERAEHAEMEAPSGIRGDMIADIEAVQQKYMSLAEAMTEHWDWRPGEGVRSVGEVYGHIAAANFMIPMLFGMEPPESYRGQTRQETMAKLSALETMGPAELMSELAHSFVHARHVVARVDEERLGETVQYFGEEGPLSEVLLLYTTHMHEHLGQSIAYARTNGVVPPWSAGGM